MQRWPFALPRAVPTHGLWLDETHTLIGVGTCCLRLFSVTLTPLTVRTEEVAAKPNVKADIWGGTADEAYDACYHQACDTFDNNNLEALDVNADAIAFSVLTYAYSTESVNGVKGKKVPGNFKVPAPVGPQGTFVGTDGSLGHDHNHDGETE